MSESALAEVQKALVEVMLQEAPCETIEAPAVLGSDVFSPLLTNYLDTLLRSATEVPEKTILEETLTEFPCLHFLIAATHFYTPLSRIGRIEHSKPNRRRFSIQIPEHGSKGRFMFQIRANQGWLFFDELVGLATIKSCDVKWRAAAHRAPWYTGTHKTLLSRIFDPELLVERQKDI